MYDGTTVCGLGDKQVATGDMKRAASLITEIVGDIGNPPQRCDACPCQSGIVDVIWLRIAPYRIGLVVRD